MTEADLKMITLKELGFSGSEIAQMFGRSTSAVQNSVRDQIDQKADMRVRTVDDLFFHNIDSEAKAYTLGFIMADGCICGKKLEIALQESDKYILQYFLDAMHSDALLKRIIIEDRVYYSFSIQSDQIIADLYKLNVTERKSLTLNPPPDSLIPKELCHHMIRGYYDGNGSIWFDKSTNNYSMNIVSTKQMLEYFRDKMGWKHNTIRLANKNNQDIYRMDYGGNNTVGNNLEKLYYDATVYLMRKYEKYLDCQNRRVSK